MKLQVLRIAELAQDKKASFQDSQNRIDTGSGGPKLVQRKSNQQFDTAIYGIR